jgi:hypothetical protein
MGLLIVALTRANSGWPPRDLDSGVWLGAARHASQQRTHRTTSKENDKWYLTFAHIGAAPHEGEQGLPSAVAICNDIDPCVRYDLPHRFVFVWIEIRWSSHQAFVLCTR